MTSPRPIDCVDDAAMSIVVGLVPHIPSQAAVELDNAGFPCEISHPLDFTAVDSMTDTGHIPQLKGHICRRCGEFLRENRTGGEGREGVHPVADGAEFARLRNFGKRNM